MFFLIMLTLLTTAHNVYQHCMFKTTNQRDGARAEAH